MQRFGDKTLVGPRLAQRERILSAKGFRILNSSRSAIVLTLPASLASSTQLKYS